MPERLGTSHSAVAAAAVDKENLLIIRFTLASVLPQLSWHRRFGVCCPGDRLSGTGGIVSVRGVSGREYGGEVFQSLWRAVFSLSPSLRETKHLTEENKGYYSASDCTG